VADLGKAHEGRRGGCCGAIAATEPVALRDIVGCWNTVPVTTHTRRWRAHEIQRRLVVVAAAVAAKISP